ncbi:hypothetical protein [Aureimonas sp. AU4]|uniref:hypothetical protein n=1 Tax=Aureimonas sp. AU4 TaxID=1638163 RepID=UPI00078178BF|nr:hypothetical protein [Aureimonas sp. AU4]
MNSHLRFPPGSRPVEAVLVGAGAFGRSLLGQGRRMPLLNVRVAVDVSAERAADAFRAVGWPEGEITLCRSAEEAREAWEAGQAVASGRLADVLELPVDIVVEASGHPEAGAAHAHAAILHDKHVALVTKETDSVVGPWLAHLARERGRLVTPVDGDQPALLIGLVTWAETLGLPIIAAGKSSEYDFVYDPEAGRIANEAAGDDVPGFEALWTLGDRPVAEVLARRAEAAARLPQRTVPDLCEMAVVANATGLRPDVPGFHVPVARIAEVADVFSETSRGGLLSGRRRLDVFNCLREADEVSFAGGVFVVVACEDAETWPILAAKGHTVSRDGRAAMLWLPRHILGLEAPISLLDTVLNARSVAPEPQPVVDLVGRAMRELPAGSLLEAVGHHHTIDGLEPALVEAGPLGNEAPAPYYLISGRRLRRAVAKGAFVTLGDLDLGEGSAMLELRRAQDRHFFGAVAQGEAA